MGCGCVGACCPAGITVAFLFWPVPLFYGCTAQTLCMALCASNHAVQSVAAACGQLPVGRAAANFTLSLISAPPSSVECQQQRAAFAAGGPPPSCSRCPQLAQQRGYTLLLVPSSGERATAQVAQVNVSTGGAWLVEPPVLVGLPPQLVGTSGDAVVLPPALVNMSAVQSAPSAVADSESSITLSFQLNAPGKLHYLVLYDTLFARFMDAYVAFNNEVGNSVVRVCVGRGGTRDCACLLQPASGLGACDSHAAPLHWVGSQQPSTFAPRHRSSALRACAPCRSPHRVTGW